MIDNALFRNGIYVIVGRRTSIGTTLWLTLLLPELQYELNSISVIGSGATHMRGVMVARSDTWVSPGYSGFLPHVHQDHRTPTSVQGPHWKSFMRYRNILGIYMMYVCFSRQLVCKYLINICLSIYFNLVHWANSRILYCTTMDQCNANMLVQRCDDEQNYIGPISFSNIGPT